MIPVSQVRVLRPRGDENSQPESRSYTPSHTMILPLKEQLKYNLLHKEYLACNPPLPDAPPSFLKPSAVLLYLGQW